MWLKRKLRGYWIDLHDWLYCAMYDDDEGCWYAYHWRFVFTVWDRESKRQILPTWSIRWAGCQFGNYLVEFYAGAKWYGRWSDRPPKPRR